MTENKNDIIISDRLKQLKNAYRSLQRSSSRYFGKKRLSYPILNRYINTSFYSVGGVSSSSTPVNYYQISSSGQISSSVKITSGKAQEIVGTASSVEIGISAFFLVICLIVPIVYIYFWIVVNNLRSGVNPTKLFFFGNEEFFPFSLLSLAVVQHTHFFLFATNSQA